MTGARRFLFGDDLRQPAPGPGERAARDEAERAAYAAGRAEGRREAEAETARRVAEACERIGLAGAAAVSGLDAAIATVEADALAFFEAQARKLAGSALAGQPLGPIADAAAVAFRHVRGQPHLAVRVHESLLEETDGLLRRLAKERGFDGRIIVLGEPDIAPGDARIEWADGGVVRDGRALDAAVADCLAAPPRTLPPEDTHP